ncbi:MAG: septum formation family protein [Propionibacteriaceae bacterium]|jgi:hypothetical protein|nr:septum formation family protein [Propionibacteriaceae bacterium]
MSYPSGSFGDGSLGSEYDPESNEFTAVPRRAAVPWKQTEEDFSLLAAPIAPATGRRFDAPENSDPIAWKPLDLTDPLDSPTPPESFPTSPTSAQDDRHDPLSDPVVEELEALVGKKNTKPAPLLYPADDSISTPSTSGLSTPLVSAGRWEPDEPIVVPPAPAFGEIRAERYNLQPAGDDDDEWDDSDAWNEDTTKTNATESDVPFLSPTFASASRKPRRRVLPIILMILIALVLGFIIVTWWNNRDDAPAPGPDPSTAPVTTPTPPVPTQNDSLPWADLAAGACFTLDESQPVSDQFPVVDCTEPHNAEVTRTQPVDETTIPEYDSGALEQFGAELCRQATFDYIGPEPTETITYGYIYPDAESWAANNRSIKCYVASSEELTGSLRDSGR